MITDNKYFQNPDSVIYVLAAGSVGYKDVQNPSFQWLRVFEKFSPKIAEVERYDFREEELVPLAPFWLPPQKNEEKSTAVLLLEILQTENSDLYYKYQTITDDFEQIINDNNIGVIIEIISNLLTIFKDIKYELQKNSILAYCILLCINYRVILLSQKHANEPKLKYKELLDRLEVALKTIFSDKSYSENLIDFLSVLSNKDLDEKYYEKIIKGVKSSDKRFSSFISITVFFTDLFLNISQYGEYYYEKENLKHKINLKLDKGLFYDNIPKPFISIEGDSDRRAVVLKFKCKNPTVHKVAVMIVKDFEMRLAKFEDSLKEINLKLYYIIPKVQPDKYELENFHFDAYIPTLLPLLTGDNLYKQKEVFIRELVQNSIDAVLLRKKLQPTESFDEVIRIEIGEKIEAKGGKPVKYFKITDQGIGMSKFTIERYFTSIGRSFYVSEEFDELKKDNNIKYQPISNFGIGFLSSFMVCKEILVKTKSCLYNSESLEVEIPNYDGCFFVRKINRETIGTEIILYEDNRGLFKFGEFVKYAKKVFLDLPVKIEWRNNTNKKNNFTIEKNSLQNSLILKKLRIENELIFFVPFNDKGVDKISWDELHKSDINTITNYGIYFNFSDFNTKAQDVFCTLNQGLVVSKNFIPVKTMFKDFTPRIYTSFPSEFIQLDVAREMVSSLKVELNESQILESLNYQIKGALQSKNQSIGNLFCSDINRMLGTIKLDFFSDMHLLTPYYYSLKIQYIENLKFKLSLIQNNEIPTSYNKEQEVYLNYQDKKNITDLIYFVTQNSKTLLKRNGKQINLESWRKGQTKRSSDEVKLLRHLDMISSESAYYRRSLGDMPNIFSKHLGPDFESLEDISEDNVLMLMDSLEVIEIRDELEMRALIHAVNDATISSIKNYDEFLGLFENVKDFHPLQKYFIFQFFYLIDSQQTRGIKVNISNVLFAFFISAKSYLLNNIKVKNTEEVSFNIIL